MTAVAAASSATSIGAGATAARLGLTLLLGCAIGIEREIKPQPAGLRTHVLVALGSALFALAGAQIIGTDKTRIAAQVASGIGFIGAGAIIRDRGRVQGITTAASLWVTASIGLAVGLGLYVAGTLFTVAALLVLAMLGWIEHLFPRTQSGRQLFVQVAPGASMHAAVAAVQAIARRVAIDAVSVREPAGPTLSLRIPMPPGADAIDLVERVRRLPEIAEVELRR